MLIAEAKWVGSVLAGLPESAFPLAHVGCQTAEFRMQVQPWVHEQVFAPLETRGVDVVHVDIRDEPGVDLVADVTTEQGQAAIRATGARTLLCANLLEHVPDPHVVLAGLLAGVVDGGHLILTGPLAFPYHPDPIDTMFRPTAGEMAEFVGADFEVLDAQDIECLTLDDYLAMRRLGRLRHRARLATPFIRTSDWRHLMDWRGRRTSAYALLVRRH